MTLGLCISVRSYFEPTNLAMLMLLSVVGVSSRSTRGPAILSSVLSVASFDFFLVPPYYTFAISDTEYLLTFAVMLTTALVVSTLTVRLRQQAEAARTREERTAALYAMSRDLAAAPDLDAVLKAAAQHIHSVFLSQVLLLLPDTTGRLAERAAEVVTYLFDVREQAVSQWVFDHGRMAGKTTDTLPLPRASTSPCAPRRASSACSACTPPIRSAWSLPNSSTSWRPSRTRSRWRSNRDWPVSCSNLPG